MKRHHTYICQHCGKTFRSNHKAYPSRPAPKYCNWTCSGAAKRVAVENRFWDKVDKNGPIPPHRPELGPCWIWTGCRPDGRYGVIQLKRRPVGAHRISYEMNVGRIPVGEQVMHKCDNPPCVRPSHLETGTCADNHKDCAEKGRDARGEKNGKYTKPDSTPRGQSHGASKFTDEDIRLIRQLSSNGVTGLQLAKRFNVTPGSIYHILSGRTWSHVR